MLRTLFCLLISNTVLFAAKPNVLLICVDDLKPLLGCYGDTVVKSPNIDRLAKRGVLFEKAYCNQAVCSPSRNALLTGLRPQALGIYELATNFRKAAPDVVTLPQHFKVNGYRAEAMGKIFHVGHGNVNDVASWSVPHFTPKTISYALKENDLPQSTREQALFENKTEAWKLPRGAATEAADVPDNKYGDGMIADEAVKRLVAAKQKPEPHLPFVAPKKYWDLYDPSSFKLPALQKAPEGAPEFAPTTWGELRQYKDVPEKGPLSEKEALHLIHGYYAATSYMDAQLGRVLDALDASGFAQNTIIVLWGDHGWHLGDHGMWCKHTNYEQAGRIPVIVAAPGIQPARTKALIESCDIYPTLAVLAQLPAPPQGDGRSFASVLRDPSTSVRDHAIHVYPRGGGLIGRAIRTQRHRLVEWKKPGDAPENAILELYDYEADPAESKNLAAEQPDVVAGLRKLLAQHPEAKPQISSKPEAKAAVEKKPVQDRGKMFDQRDKNKDGQLTKEEFLINQPDPDEAPKRWTKFDTDGSGTLSREEFIKGGKK